MNYDSSPTDFNSRAPRQARPFIQVDRGIRRSQGYIDLCFRLGEPRCLDYLCGLWDWALDARCRDGRIKCDARFLAHVCDWQGDPSVFWSALVATGWIRPLADGEVYLCGWAERYGAMFARLDAKAAAERERRKSHDADIDKRAERKRKRAAAEKKRRQQAAQRGLSVAKCGGHVAATAEPRGEHGSDACLLTSGGAGELNADSCVVSTWLPRAAKEVDVLRELSLSHTDLNLAASPQKPATALLQASEATRPFGDSAFEHPSARSQQQKVDAPPRSLATVTPLPTARDIAGDPRLLRPADFESVCVDEHKTPLMIVGKYIALRSTLAPFSRGEIDRGFAQAREMGSKVTQAMVLRKIEFERNTSAAQPMMTTNTTTTTTPKPRLSYSGETLQRAYDFAMNCKGTGT